MYSSYTRMIWGVIHYIFTYLLSYSSKKIIKEIWNFIWPDLDPLVISNYRPVSILPIFSKLFEKVIETQLNHFFDSIFSPYLCAFRW
jgi:hypothetical protein